MIEDVVNDTLKKKLTIYPTWNDIEESCVPNWRFDNLRNDFSTTSNTVTNNAIELSNIQSNNWSRVRFQSYIDGPALLSAEHGATYKIVNADPNFIGFENITITSERCQFTTSRNDYELTFTFKKYSTSWTDDDYINGYPATITVKLQVKTSSNYSTITLTKEVTVFPRLFTIDCNLPYIPFNVYSSDFNGQLIFSDVTAGTYPMPKKFTTTQVMTELKEGYDCFKVFPQRRYIYDNMSDHQFKAQIDLGVYIQHVDKSLYTIQEWKAYSFTNDDANGVAVITENNSFVLSKIGYTGSSSSNESRLSYSNAVTYANNYVFPSGVAGRLMTRDDVPALTENKTLIDTALSIIGGKTFDEGTYYFLLDDNNNSRIWPVMQWRYMGVQSLQSSSEPSYYVRPVGSIV